MRRILGALIASTSLLVGCIANDYSNCPKAPMLYFDLHDSYDNANFDSAIRGDLHIYLFDYFRLAEHIVVPHDKFTNGKGLRLPHSSFNMGSVRVVALAAGASGGGPPFVPQWSKGTHYGQIAFGLSTLRSNNSSIGAIPELYFGATHFEPKDNRESCLIKLIHSYCRVEVEVLDQNGTFTNNSLPRVVVEGTMSSMDLDGNARGEMVVLSPPMQKSASVPNLYSSGIFGTLPSPRGAVLSVSIYNNQTLIQRLSMPDNIYPCGAFAGGLIKFEFSTGTSGYILTVNDFRTRIELIDQL